MHPAIDERFAFLREIAGRWWVRIFLFLWAASGVWDLALSQWVPEVYARRLPKVYQVVAMTAGLFSWQLWLLVGAAILVAGALEYAFRHKKKLEAVAYGHTAQSATAQVSKPKIRAIIAFLCMVALLSAFGWHVATLPSPVPIQALPASPPNEIAKPWVTKEEIAKEQKVGRILLVYKPEELINIRIKYYGQPGIDPYVDKWFKTSNEFISLAKETIDKKDYYRVRAGTSFRNMLLYFDPEKWESKIIQMKEGDDVRAICRLAGFDGFLLLGYDCELL